jgi:hypothetical protein
MHNYGSGLPRGYMQAIHPAAPPTCRATATSPTRLARLDRSLEHPGSAGQCIPQKAVRLTDRRVAQSMDSRCSNSEIGNDRLCRPIRLANGFRSHRQHASPRTSLRAATAPYGRALGASVGARPGDAPARLRGGRQLAAGLIGLPDRGRVGFGDDIYTTRVAIPLRRFFLLTG